MTHVHVGSRFISDGDLGTVRFIGEVPPTKGVWLGVEWDDPERGKHNGTKDGTQYFQTKHPRSGSFIREHKADFGVPLIEAVKERYGKTSDSSGGVDETDLFVMGKNQQTSVEFVGAQKVNIQQSRFNNLKEVILRDMAVRCAGDVASLIPRVEELDVSKTLISSWEEISEITSQLQLLTSLNVSDNRLQIPKDDSIAEAFVGVKTLLMNRMDYTWEDILTCTKLIPKLETLHACFNQVTSIDIPHNNTMCYMTLLNLESNPIKSWEEVINLGHLPRLKRLILNNTGIERIHFPDTEADKKSPLFTQLQSLSIIGNKIDDWQSVNHLNKLKSLQDIKFQKNPLSEKLSEATFRQLVIAKIGKLKKCNMSQVTDTERKESEVDYLKHYGKEWRSSGGHQEPDKNQPSNEFTDAHPRYQSLIDKYGPPEDSELVQHSTALKNSLISVKLDSPQIPNRKLPYTMTIQKLRALVHRLFKVDAVTIHLTYSSHKVPDSEYELENDQREIGYYAIENGDTIHVKW